MAHNFGSLLFTPAVKALQERHGSRRQYARFEGEASRDRLGSDEKGFLAERDSFYIASVAANGWPYVQHRGGPAGFLKVLDASTIAFADFRGNKQYISQGNLATDDRVALIFVDYAAQTRLKILGHAETFDLASPDAAQALRAKELLERVRLPGYKAEPESVFVIHVEAYDWNCPQHITPRYTKEQIQEAVAPLEKRLQGLEQENQALRQKLAK